MKRLFIVLLVISMIFVCSCKEADKNEENTESDFFDNTELNLQAYEPYKVYEVGGYDYTSDANHTSEIILSTEYYSKDQRIEDKKISLVQGKCGKFAYVESRLGYWYNSKLDYYTGIDDEGFEVLIGINEKTGIIDSYKRSDEDNIDTSKFTLKSQEECLKIAKDYFLSYVDNIEEYSLVSEYYSDYFEEYTFTFVRYIGDMQTSERAIIDVSIYGYIDSHQFYCLGELKEALIPDAETLAELDVKVTEKLDEIYSTVKDKKKVAYGERDVALTRLSDGHYALEYKIEVRLSMDDDYSYGELTHLIIYLD